MFIIAGNNFCLKHGLMNKGKGHYKFRTVVSKSEVSYCFKKWRYFNTVKPLITKTSEEFIKCRLDNFSMSFILYYVNFSICENK